MCGAERGTGRVPDMASTTPEPGWRYDSISCLLGALGKEPKKPVILCTGRRVDRDKCFKFQDKLWSKLFGIASVLLHSDVNVRTHS